LGISIPAILNRDGDIIGS